MNDPGPAWRELSESEAEAMRPITIHVAGLSDAAIAQVDAECRAMFVRCIAAFVRQFDRPPDDAEAELLARAVAEHCNQHLVPELRAQATLH